MLSQLQWQQLKNLDICYSEIIIAINESERILQEFFPHLYEEAEKSWIAGMRSFVKPEPSQKQTMKNTLDKIRIQ
jgi:hypothetical protein